MTQAQAINLLKTGANAFITGPAGSGKTFVVNEYIKYLKQHNVSVGVTASTGIAATHLGGVTIHSWSGMGVRHVLLDEDLESLAENNNVSKRIQEVKVLIIDEVSMLHDFRLDMTDSVLKHLKKSDLPFGGIQIVLCGDFFQLPPVSRYDEPAAKFIYHSEAWKKGKFAVCYLSENYRQKNDSLTGILNTIRSGQVSDEVKDLLLSRSKQNFDSEMTIDISDDVVESTPTKLFTHNVNVDEVNERELQRMDEAEIKYEMTFRGKKHLVESLKKSCLAPEILRLKKGARVMCVKNNFDKGYVNGTLGVVISCAPDSDPVIKTAKGESITIEKADWQIEDEGRVLAQITQYPLRLAWAITVHKSQGMSLDAIEVDLSKSFEPGMGYVALSRVRTLAGLNILGMNDFSLKVHPEVLVYDRELKRQSETFANLISTASETELQNSQKEFLAKIAPLHSLKKKKSKRGEQEKNSTYDRTAELVKAQKSLSDIAKIRNMTVDTIINHLEELVKQSAVTLTGQKSPDKIDISYLKYELSMRHLDQITKALENAALEQGDNKPPLLSVIKSKLGPNVSFKEIRLARVLLGYIKPQE